MCYVKFELSALDKQVEISPRYVDPQSEASSVKRLELKILTRGWHNIECTTIDSMGNVLGKSPQKQISIHEQVIY